MHSTIAPCHEGTKEVAYACKVALNGLSSSRVIGQSETYHSCLQLPLTLFSEDMFEIRICGWYKLRINKEILPFENDIFSKYYARKSNFNMSLWQFFSHTHPTTTDNKLKIPFASGLNCIPTYPPTAAYARGALIKHFPWSKCNQLQLNSDTDVLQLFDRFLKSRICPKLLTNEMERVEFQYHTHLKEPTNKKIHEVNITDEMSDCDHEDVEHITAMNSFPREMRLTYGNDEYVFDRGIHFNWNKRLSSNDYLLRIISMEYKGISVMMKNFT